MVQSLQRNDARSNKSTGNAGPSHTWQLNKLQSFWTNKLPTILHTWPLQHENLPPWTSEHLGLEPLHWHSIPAPQTLQLFNHSQEHHCIIPQRKKVIIQTDTSEYGLHAALIWGEWPICVMTQDDTSQSFLK